MMNNWEIFTVSNYAVSFSGWNKNYFKTRIRYRSECISVDWGSSIGVF
jgi:hypothetical protein